MENKDLRGRVAEYLELYKEIRAKTQDERAAWTILQEVSKDMRMSQIREERQNGNGNSQVATPKQLQYLEKLGVETRPGLTKQQASALIDEAIAKESEEDSYRYVPENAPIPWQAVEWS
jgi:hypothetical protein